MFFFTYTCAGPSFHPKSFHVDVFRFEESSQMSSSEDAPAFRPPEVSKTAFLGIVWGGLGVSLFFLLLRAYVRLTCFHRFFIDDGLLLLAWILLLTLTSLWQNMVDDLYFLYSINLGTTQPPADILIILYAIYHRTFAVSLLTIFSLWSIKASFLAFFYKLGYRVPGHKILWWIASTASFIGFAISIGVLNYKCVIGSQVQTFGRISRPSSLLDCPE